MARWLRLADSCLYEADRGYHSAMQCKAQASSKCSVVFANVNEMMCVKVLIATEAGGC